MQQQDFEFVTYNNDSSIKPFFDHFNRISVSVQKCRIV
jgi:hypothetical protein